MTDHVGNLNCVVWYGGPDCCHAGIGGKTGSFEASEILLCTFHSGRGGFIFWCKGGDTG
jgi:hypothetical protein